MAEPPDADGTLTRKSAGEKKNRPMSVFQNYFQNLWKQASNPSVLFRNVSNASSVVQRLRNISTPQIVAGGVVAAECLGFFTAGEMLGRLKIVGYHGESGAHH